MSAQQTAGVAPCRSESAARPALPPTGHVLTCALKVGRLWVGGVCLGPLSAPSISFRCGPSCRHRTAVEALRCVRRIVALYAAAGVDVRGVRS